MKGVHMNIICAMALLSLVSAQFYGSYGNYGRDVLIRPQAPIPYPQNAYQIQSRLAPLPLTRTPEMPHNVRMAATQISRGSEQFSFDMFQVSSFRSEIDQFMRSSNQVSD